MLKSVSRGLKFFIARKGSMGPLFYHMVVALYLQIGELIVLGWRASKSPSVKSGWLVACLGGAVGAPTWQSFSAPGSGCSMGAPATSSPTSSAGDVGVLDAVAEESAQLGPFHVRRFVHVARKLVDLDVVDLTSRNSTSGRWLWSPAFWDRPRFNL
ncbi:hypothetical protein BHE74_00040869 [Ensete ventricosum]|nr:hypothetical protein BHE74_00040869 [Ensete ventricosum]